LLLIAANISMRERKLAKEAKKKKETKEINWQRIASTSKATAKNLRDKQSFYKTFFTKLGKRDLKNRDYEDFFKSIGTDELLKLGLDPDEIRIKLDQIMEWNDPNFKPRETNE
jgi:ABC-type Fe3+-citrate transport system substrate-binding protein